MLGAGFTLVEILVSMTVMLILVSIVVVYSGGAREINAVLIEEAKIGEVLLRARSLAFATYGRGGGARAGVCGYGVSIDYPANSYALFKYKPLPNPVDPCGRNDGSIFKHNNIQDARKEVLERHIVSNNVRLVLLGAPPYCDALKDVLFVPPEPRTVFDSVGGNSCGSAISKTRFGLVSDQGGAKAEIEINQFGLLSYK